MSAASDDYYEFRVIRPTEDPEEQKRRCDECISTLEIPHQFEAVKLGKGVASRLDFSKFDARHYRRVLGELTRYD